MPKLLKKPTLLSQDLVTCTKEKEILEIKFKKKKILLARRIVKSYMEGVNAYATIGWRVNPIRNGNQPDISRALIGKLIHLEPNDWPKFQKQLKNLHSS